MAEAALSEQDTDTKPKMSNAADRRRKTRFKPKEAPVVSSSTLDRLEENFLSRTTQQEDEGVIGTFKRWSSSAVECYLRDAQCEGCYYARFFDDKPYDCKMHLAVSQLLETHGQPTRNMIAKHS
jgi:hypothetical protein